MQQFIGRLSANRHGKCPQRTIRLWESSRINTSLINDFSIDKYEVTAGDYKNCVDAGACQYTAQHQQDRTYGISSRDNHPINYVTWAKPKPIAHGWASGSQLKSSGKRRREVPTADYFLGVTQTPRARMGTVCLKSSSPTELVSCNPEYASQPTLPVGYYNGSNLNLDIFRNNNQQLDIPYGAYDMAGNVSEYTSSTFADSDSSIFHCPVGKGSGFTSSISSDSYLYMRNGPCSRVPVCLTSNRNDWGFRCAR